MFPAQTPRTNPDNYSRCEELGQKEADHGKGPGPSQKTDTAIKGFVDRALWKDDVLRAIDYYDIDVHVKNGVVYLNGHIVGATSQNRIKNALRGIPGLLGIQNNLVVDDKLTLEVAASLGKLEHINACKFFTGASHGVISLNGIVGDENVKLLAEKCAASNPSVRGVMNHVRVSGAELELLEQPFLQPTIGETIYFLDWISGVVKQVIMNPNNRRVIAMTVQGKFTDLSYEFNSPTDGKAWLPEQLVTVPMSVVRYLTKVSGFLDIKSNERNRYLDFDPGSFRSPGGDWVPPYPYCPDDVLFPVEPQDVENHILQQIPATPIPVASKEQLLWEQLLANDSFGG
jgi:osmotically-inducible protein OsmY